MEKRAESTSVLITAEQPPVPVVITASDGITPISGYVPDGPPSATSPIAPVSQAIPIGTPVNMTIVAPAPTPVPVSKGENLTLPPTTTAQQDVVTEGQRHINLIWESVQGFISVSITLAVIYCQIYKIQSETLNNAFFFVVATYLQRSNHIRIGGVGEKPYEGR